MGFKCQRKAIRGFLSRLIYQLIYLGFCREQDSNLRPTGWYEVTLVCTADLHNIQNYAASSTRRGKIKKKNILPKPLTGMAILCILCRKIRQCSRGLLLGLEKKSYGTFLRVFKFLVRVFAPGLLIEKMNVPCHATHLKWVGVSDVECLSPR